MINNLFDFLVIIGWCDVMGLQQHPAFDRARRDEDAEGAQAQVSRFIK